VRMGRQAPKSIFNSTSQIGNSTARLVMSRDYHATSPTVSQIQGGGGREGVCGAAVMETEKKLVAKLGGCRRRRGCRRHTGWWISTDGSGGTPLSSYGLGASAATSSIDDSKYRSVRRARQETHPQQAAGWWWRRRSHGRGQRTELNERRRKQAGRLGIDGRKVGRVEVDNGGREVDDARGHVLTLTRDGTHLKFPP
jgi:hypothetical protein